MVPVGSVGTVHLFYEWKFLQLTGQEWFSVHGKISITAKIWRCTLNFSLQYHLVINFGARVSIYFIGHRVHRNIPFPPILIVEHHNCCDEGSGACTPYNEQYNSSVVLLHASSWFCWVNLIWTMLLEHSIVIDLLISVWNCRNGLPWTICSSYNEIMHFQVSGQRIRSQIFESLKT